MRRIRRFLVRLFALALIGLAAAGWWFRGQLQPLNPSDKVRYVRFEERTTLLKALARLEDGKVLKSAWATRIWSKWLKTPPLVRAGTYELGGNLSAGEILTALQKPVRRMVRIPETNWSARTANLLEKEQLGTAREYLSWVGSPTSFADQVEFPLPKTSLEGYLYPDTYDLPPLMGSKDVIRRQLANFQKRVWVGLNKPKNLNRAVIIGSLVELEVARDEERPLVASVIENRLAKNMPLQIDAAINYGLQEWRPLTFADYRNVDSPYNLYRHKGLPPGPICSPSVKSITAALHPAKTNYLYYVALPSGQSLFSETYEGHLKNIEKRKAALAEAGQR